MRTLALVTDAFGGHGGIAQANRDLLESLATADTTNQIVVLPRKAGQVVTGLTKHVHQKNPQMGKLAYVIGVSRSLLRDGPFDMIFCGHLFMGPFAAILSHLTNIPFWLHVHGIEAWEKQSSFVQWAVQKANLITAISRYTRRRFISWANVAPERVKILPDTVNEKFKPGPKPVYLIERYGLNGKKVLLTVGRLSHEEKYKGHDKIITALPNLLKKHPNIIYVVVGDGDDRTRLEAMTKEVGVANNVFFIGQASDAELADMYRLADLFVMPSTGEGFGIVFLEAAASGVPVVGGNQDGSYDALLEGRIGRVIDPADEDELCKAIFDGLDSKVDVQKMVGRFSRQNFSSHVRKLAREVICVAE